MRRDGDQAGVAWASVARWLLRILVATAVVVVGLALAATTAQADVKPAPLGSAGKLTQTGRPGGGTATKVKAAARSTVPKTTIRVKAQATPVRRVARKAPVRTYRVAKATRTVVRKAAPARTYRPKATRTVVRKAAPVRTYRAKATRSVVRKTAPVRTRISTVQRKNSPRPTVRAVRKATAPKVRQAQRVKTSPTKINSSPSKITRSSAQPNAEVGLTVPAVKVADLPVSGTRVPAVGTPEIKVTVGSSVNLSAPSVGLRIPLLSLPRVTLPPTELPTVTVPGTDLPRVILPPTELPTVTLPRTVPTVALPRSDLPTASLPAGKVTAAGPVPTVDQRAGPVDGAALGRAAQVETAEKALGLVAGGPTVVTAYTALMVSLDAGVLRAIGPPAAVILDELGQRIRAVEVPAALGPATALIIAAAIGAAATGTASSGSAGGGGPAVVPTAFRLPALGGSRRLNSRLRESAFRTPHRPGFSPD